MESVAQVRRIIVQIFLKFLLLHTGYAQCYICGATATQMSEPQGVLHWFIPKPGTLMLGIHPLHIEMQAFNWFNKTAFHQDFRNWRCSGIFDIKFFFCL